MTDDGNSPCSELPADRPIVLFDGVCNLCSGAVQFLLEHDDGQLRFAPLQSEPGQTLVDRFDLDDADTIVFVEGEAAYTHSAAALRIARHLDSPWSWLGLLRYVPRPLRDLGYRLVARSRYRVFGTRDRCLLPTPEIKERFLDGAELVVNDEIE